MDVDLSFCRLISVAQAAAAFKRFGEGHAGLCRKIRREEYLLHRQHEKMRIMIRQMESGKPIDLKMFDGWR